MKFSFSIESSRAKREMHDTIAVRPLSAEQARLINPEGAQFTPGIPLPAVSAGIEPIRFPPPDGTNLDYGDKKQQYGGTRNDTLRFFADNCTPIRVVMEQLKREMRGIAVDVLKKEEVTGPKKKGGQETDAKRDALREWLRRPDGELMFADWLNSVLEDLLVIGSTALARLRTVAGQPAGLRPIDAAIITPILTPTGRAPEAPAPAFYQVAYGLPYREFTRDELLYRPFNRRTWTPYGYSPVEATLMYVILALNHTVWWTNAYSEASLPPGFFTLPDTWSPAMIKEFDDLTVQMAGNTAERHHARHYPKGTTYQSIKGDSVQWQYEFVEQLMRIFSWAIGVSAAPIVKQSSLGQGSEGLSEEALAAGVKPYQDFVEEMLDDYVASADTGLTCQGDAIPLGLAEPDYTVEWVEAREENREQQLREDVDLARIAARTINEIREAHGEEPFDEKEYPEAAQPMVLTATGYVPLKGSSEPKPPPVPFGGMPPKGEVPPKIAGNAKKLQEQAGKEKQPPEVAAKADISKWKRAAKADRRKGNGPREFDSDVVPPGTRNWIEKNLAFGEVGKAFRNPVRNDVRSFSTSQRGDAVIVDATNWWTKFLKGVAAHYTAAAVAALEKKGKA